MKGYRHMEYDDRIKMEALLNAGHSKDEIVSLLGFSRSTIYREYKRGLYSRNEDWNFNIYYSADIGQQIYDYNATNKGPQLKIGNDYEFVHYMEDMIVNKKYSPYAALADINYNSIAMCARAQYIIT